MDFTLTEPERDLLELGRAYAEREIATVASQAWHEERCPTEVLLGLGSLGLLGTLVPEKWGGIGSSTVGFVAWLKPWQPWIHRSRQPGRRTRRSAASRWCSCSATTSGSDGFGRWPRGGSSARSA